MGNIYIAKNIINNKVYIGKTVGTIKKRMLEHLSDSINSKKTLFHKAINKYGFDNFKWEVLFESIDDEILLDKEIEYIKIYNSMYPNGYNMTIGGEGTTGHRHSEKTIFELKKIHTGKKHSQETKEKISNTRTRSPCVCVETGVEYNSLLEAGKKTGINHNHIRSVCFGLRCSAGGYTWKLKNKSNISKENTKDKKVINLLTLKIYKSISEASRRNNISWDKIKKDCSKFGIEWRYYES